MKFSHLSMLGLLVTSIPTSWAQTPVCNTLKECNQLKVEARIQELLKDETLSLGDIVKDAHGKVRTMNQYDADKYCKSIGSRLPTARELALYSQSLGARGILETSYSGIDSASSKVQTEITQMDKEGYYPIYTKNSAEKTVVDFYLNYSGYQRPAGDFGNYWFWSSLVHPYYSYNAYDLDGYNGGIGNYNRSNDDLIAVRCVRSR